MKKLIVNTGGRELLHDDLLALQDHILLTTQALAGVTQACILSGCRPFQEVGGVRLTAGLVYISGEILRFPGATGLTLPIEIVTGASVDSDVRRYESGPDSAGARETFALARAAGPIPTGKVTITDMTGGLTYADAIGAANRPLGLVEFLAVAPATGAYDAQGRGQGRNKGWQLLTAAAGRFPVIYDPNNAQYAVGATGGVAEVALTLDQMPMHQHATRDSFTSLAVEQFLADQQNPPQYIQAEENLVGLGLGIAVNTQTHVSTSVGSNQPHENRPPFFALLARQWVGL